MSFEELTRVTVDGHDYFVQAVTRNNNDSFRVEHVSGIVVEDSFGECNPLRALWSDWQYRGVHGAARASMELRCIKDAVRRAVQDHLEFSLELCEENL